MTVMLVILNMAADVPVILYLITIPCDTALLIVAMLTGVIHK